MELVNQSTTLEPLYKVKLREAIDKYKQQYTVYYAGFKMTDYSSSDIMELLKIRDETNAYIQSLDTRQYQDFVIDLKEVISAEFFPQIEEYKKEKQRILDAHKAECERLQSEYEAEVAKATEEARQPIATLAAKHAKLLKYRTQFADILVRYNISPSDIQISPDISKEDFDLLLDSSLAVCRRFAKRSNNKFSKILTWPMQETDIRFKSWWLVGLFVLVYVSAPFLFVALVMYSYVSVSSIYKQIDRLRIAEALMFSLENFDEFLVPEDIRTVEAPDIQSIEKSARIKVSELKDPNIELQNELALADAAAVEIDTAIININTGKKAMHTEMMRLCKERLRKLDELIEDIKSKMQRFGTHIHNKSVPTRKYVISRMSDTLEFSIELPIQNIVFNSAQRVEMLNYMKLLFANEILNIKEKHLYVTIFDPSGLGADFAEFFNKTTEEYITVHIKDPASLVDKFVTEAQVNIRLLGNKSLDEYNAENEAIGKTTIDYKMLIVLSSVEKFMKIDNIVDFLQYSARIGITVWLFDPNPIKGCRFIEAPYKDDKGTLINWDYDLAKIVMNTYCDAIINSTVDTIFYHESFMPRYIPPEKYWTFSTLKGIDLHFGLADGDPTQGFAITLGDGNVHALMGGRTGAGKSAQINQMIASLLLMYSPDELELCMVDFKNVEFSFYSRTEKTGLDEKGKLIKEAVPLLDIEMGKALIPHAKILAGTKDGEYALSIFTWLLTEMERRQALFSSKGVKKLEEYRQRYPDEVLPRILVIIDEFQVMFTQVPPRIVDKIQTLITNLSKLARAAGCHLFFTSQSMKGTINKDTLEQFSLRAMLRCTADASNDILGNDAASKIKSKFGYVYTNDSAGQDASRNIMWRAPLITTPKLFDVIVITNKLAKEKNIKGYNAEFYDEKKLEPVEHLMNHYKMYPDAYKDPRGFILGERTAYSENKAPFNIIMTRDDGENMAIGAFERADMMNLTMTIIDNIKATNKAVLLLNTSDTDTFNLLDLDKQVDAKFASLTPPSVETEDLIDALEGLVDARRNGQVDVDTAPPIFFLAINWEKRIGIGREQNFKIFDRFCHLLQWGPPNGVHFIMIMREPGELAGKAASFSNHRIAGKMSDRFSNRLIESDSPSKLPDPKEGIFAYYYYSGNLTKFKIYQHKFTKQLPSREVVIK